MVANSLNYIVQMFIKNGMLIEDVNESLGRYINNGNLTNLDYLSLEEQKQFVDTFQGCVDEMLSGKYVHLDNFVLMKKCAEQLQEYIKLAEENNWDGVYWDEFIETGLISKDTVDLICHIWGSNPCIFQEVLKYITGCESWEHFKGKRDIGDFCTE